MKEKCKKCEHKEKCGEFKKGVKEKGLFSALDELLGGNDLETTVNKEEAKDKNSPQHISNLMKGLMATIEASTKKAEGVMEIKYKDGDTLEFKGTDNGIYNQVHLKEALFQNTKKHKLPVDMTAFSTAISLLEKEHGEPKSALIAFKSKDKFTKTFTGDGPSKYSTLTTLVAEQLSKEGDRMDFMKDKFIEGLEKSLKLLKGGKYDG